MRTFFELLPFQIELLLPGRWHRVWRTKLTRIVTVGAHYVPSARRRLFIDMAVISNHDAGTGVQRVVRQVALALMNEAPAQWDIRFVSATRKKPYYQITWPEFNADVDPEDMRAKPGDVFLGLDYSLDAIRRHRRQLVRFRRDGGSLWFLVHDLLPFLRPEWFSRNTVIRYNIWLGIMAGLADGFLCNSAQTEDDLKEALASVYGLVNGYRTLVLPMGCLNFDKKMSQSVQRIGSTPPQFDLSLPFALMVGTLEPRKGHADIIDAFEIFWSKGAQDKLVLVGRLGWKVEALRDRILAHPQYGTKLLWFNEVEDVELFQIYESCIGVIVASYGEGFGLPLIEALGRDKPVLARDLPVFRMHEGKGVNFFPFDARPTELAQTVEEWLCSVREGRITVTRPSDNWQDAAKLFLTAIS